MLLISINAFVNLTCRQTDGILQPERHDADRVDINAGGVGVHCTCRIWGEGILCPHCLPVFGCVVNNRSRVLAFYVHIYINPR